MLQVLPTNFSPLICACGATSFEVFRRVSGHGGEIWGWELRCACSLRTNLRVDVPVVKQRLHEQTYRYQEPIAPTFGIVDVVPGEVVSSSANAPSTVSTIVFSDD